MEKMMILPVEIILEIFSWLPVRSVGRFRTLSKLYHKLLSEPSFTKNHLCHGSRISSPKVVVKICVNMTWDVSETWNCYFSIDNNITSDTNDGSEIYDYSYGVVDDSICVSNSCNGLICVSDSKCILSLCNPTTREVTRLPEFPNGNKLHPYTLCYDSLNEDYKIVVVTYNSKITEGMLETDTFMYSHKRGCWKKIEPFPPYGIHSSRGACMHGKIHWIAYEDGKVQTLCIVSLEIADESYGTIPLPANYRYCSRIKSPDIHVLGGELCVFINNGYWGRGCEIWMMREYGVEQSWFQLLTIPVNNLEFYGINRYAHVNCVPLFLMKSGVILLRHGRSIYLYYPKTCNFVTVFTISPRYFLARGAIGVIHVESLVETARSYKGQKSFVAQA